MNHTYFPVQTCVALVAATAHAVAMLLVVLAKLRYGCCMLLLLCVHVYTGKKSIACTDHEFVHEQSK
jgi:hypothetical protein